MLFFCHGNLSMSSQQCRGWVLEQHRMFGWGQRALTSQAWAHISSWKGHIALQNQHCKIYSAVSCASQCVCMHVTIKSTLLWGSSYLCVAVMRLCGLLLLLWCASDSLHIWFIQHKRDLNHPGLSLPSICLSYDPDDPLSWKNPLCFFRNSKKWQHAVGLADEWLMCFAWTWDKH